MNQINKTYTLVLLFAAIVFMMLWRKQRRSKRRIRRQNAIAMPTQGVSESIVNTSDNANSISLDDLEGRNDTNSGMDYFYIDKPTENMTLNYPSTEAPSNANAIPATRVGMFNGAKMFTKTKLFTISMILILTLVLLYGVTFTRKLN